MEERDNRLPINYFVAIRTIVHLFSKSILLSILQNKQTILNTRNSKIEKKILKKYSIAMKLT